MLPSCITSPGTNQSSEQEWSDLQMYQRWKRKIPFQLPEGTWLQISELLRKIKHSGGPRGCIPAGILASPSSQLEERSCEHKQDTSRDGSTFLWAPAQVASPADVIALTTHSPAAPHPVLRWRIHSPFKCCVCSAPPAPNTQL